jgi:hypothetical protein
VKFPANTEKNREFVEISPLQANRGAEANDFQRPSGPIPCAAEQGIKSREQGGIYQDHGPEGHNCIGASIKAAAPFFRHLALEPASRLLQNTDAAGLTADNVRKRAMAL